MRRSIAHSCTAAHVSRPNTAIKNAHAQGMFIDIIAHYCRNQNDDNTNHLNNHKNSIQTI